MNYTYRNYFNDALSAKEQMEAIKSLCKLEIANKKARENEVNRYALLGLNHYAKQNLLTKTKIDSILAIMSPESANFFKKCFLGRNKKENYDDLNMSKSTYYRARKKVIEEFLYYYLNV